MNLKEVKVNSQTIGIVCNDLDGQCTALALALAGNNVKLYDLHTASIGQTMAEIETLLSRMIAKRKITMVFARQTLARITVADEMKAFEACDFVIDALSEKIEVKQDILKAFERVVRLECCIATNAANVPLEMLSACLSNPRRFVGLRSSELARTYNSVEVVRGPQTSEPTYLAARELIDQLRSVSLEIEVFGQRIRPAIAASGISVGKVVGALRLAG